MSYLVYCPTCSRKMSVNARSCPNCGESQFYERVPTEVLKDCIWCNGTGYAKYSNDGYSPCHACSSGKKKEIVYVDRDIRKRAT